MKRIKYILATAIIIGIFAACEKKDYPRGVEDMEHHYYAIFVPNNNTGVSVFRNQATVIKFPVQFYSTYTRSYDAVAKYAISTSGFANPAIAGTDFNIVDKNGAVIPSADTTYTMVFPEAK